MELDLRSSRRLHGCFPLDHGVAAHDDSFRLNFNGIMPAFPAYRPWACIPEDGALILRCRGHSSQLDPGDFRLGVDKWIGREGFAPTRERMQNTAVRNCKAHPVSAAHRSHAFSIQSGTLESTGTKSGIATSSNSISHGRRRTSSSCLFPAARQICRQCRWKIRQPADLEPVNRDHVYELFSLGNKGYSLPDL